MTDVLTGIATTSEKHGVLLSTTAASKVKSLYEQDLRLLRAIHGGDE